MVTFLCQFDLQYDERNEIIKKSPVWYLLQKTAKCWNRIEIVSEKCENKSEVLFNTGFSKGL